MANKTPDLNLLRIAFALYDELSVSRAARLLGMSQPAVSMALRRMRETFNDPLFLRVPTGIAPTPRAHALVRMARPLVDRLHHDLFKEDTFDPATTTGRFTIALSDVGEVSYLPRLLQLLREHAPLCSVRSVSVPPPQLAHDLEKGDIDLAVGYFPTLNSKNFRQRKLWTHHFACVMRADHPRRADRITLKDYLAMEHIVVQGEGRSQEVLERFLSRRRVRRRVVLETPNFLSIPTIVARSDLVATVPQAVAGYFASMSPRLAMATPPFDLTGYDLKQHWHRRFDKEPRNRWLRQQFEQMFKDGSWRMSAL